MLQLTTVPIDHINIDHGPDSSHTEVHPARPAEGVREGGRRPPLHPPHVCVCVCVCVCTCAWFATFRTVSDRDCVRSGLCPIGTVSVVKLNVVNLNVVNRDRGQY